MKTFAGNIHPGDMVRHDATEAIWREVIDVERHGDGTVTIVVAVGAMMEKLPPMRHEQHIEVTRA